MTEVLLLILLGLNVATLAAVAVGLGRLRTYKQEIDARLERLAAAPGGDAPAVVGDFPKDSYPMW